MTASDLFAPTWLYGEPDDMRSFVNEAHAQGIAVILDVVYNHLGPDGNYLGAFSPWYFSSKHKNDWGEASTSMANTPAPVREFFLANAQLLDQRVSSGRSASGCDAGHP